MKVALYARVSTTDKDQDPENQLRPLRELVANMAGWQVWSEYVDYASAGDFGARKAWGRLVRDAARGRFKLLLIWKIDRAFRSVLDAATHLERFRAWGVSMRSLTEPWADTSSRMGEALYYFLATFAQMEREILADRVRAGMARAISQGKHVGRPRVVDRPGFREAWEELLPDILSGSIPIRAAAKRLGVDQHTVRRLLDGMGYLRRQE